KCLNLRIFEDGYGRLNLSALDLNLEILVISNFTVAGETRKGRRPSFDKAERPEVAKEKFDRFVQLLRDSGLKVETGEFRAIMEVELVNHGPVTVIVHVPPKTTAQK
ncbi:MAG: D-tyrosyl-tRNA(Tyr) deacylase, partial [Candidatus Altiarchaeales archaeon]